MLSSSTEKQTYNELREFLISNGIIPNRKKLTITDFYEYVFGDKAEVKPVSHIALKKIKLKKINNEIVPIKLTSQKNKKSLNEDEINQVKIQKLKNELRVFNELLANRNLSPIFRKMLRQTKAESLEKILFGNVSDVLIEEFPNKYSFPSDEEIREIFIEQNKKYHILRESEFQKLSDTYVTYFKACKLIADYIEKNNDVDNAIVALHAYKMLVFFGTSAPKNKPFANIENYLVAHKLYKKRRPICDALVADLPIDINHEIMDLSGWQDFISIHGPKAMQYFEKSPGIEKILMSAPRNMKQALQAAVECTYKHYGKYPLLASLCMQFNRKEEIFDKCLETNKKIQTQDILPAIDIDGSTISDECSGYYLVKLPINDPRAYMLGKIINNCQSMGGASEATVINGMIREDSGFYVSLKRKKKSTSSSPRLKYGYINYNDFTIVGQGNAWFSRLGNFTFDSWDNLRLREKINDCFLVKSDEISQLELSWHQESYRDIFEENNLCILYKKKLFYFNKVKREISEIFSIAEKNDELFSRLTQLKVNHCVLANDRECHLISDAISSPDDGIATVMLRNFSEKIVMHPDSTIIRVTIGCGNYCNTPYEFKSADKITPPEKLFKGYQDEDSEVQSVIILNKDKQERIISLLTDTLKTVFKEHAEENKILFNEITYFFSMGAKFSIKRFEWINTLLSQEKNRGLIKAIVGKLSEKNSSWHRDMYSHIWEILYCLDEADILHEDNYDILDRVYLFNNDMDNAIYTLAQNYLLVPVFKDFCEQVKNLKVVFLANIAKSYKLLSRDSLFSYLFYKILMINPERTLEHLNILFNLSRHNLASDTIINALLECKVYFFEITKNIKRLNKHGLLNRMNFEKIISKAPYADIIARILRYLPDISQCEFDKLILHAQSAIDIYRELFLLETNNPLLIKGDATAILNLYLMKFEFNDLNIYYESSKEHYTDSNSLQMFFGSYNASTWESMATELIFAAIQRLKEMLSTIESEEDKIKMINHAQGLTIFKEHVEFQMDSLHVPSKLSHG